MAIDISIPKLGMTMTKAKLAEWKAAEGDPIPKGQVVLVIETEKVTYEVEAQGEGLLHIVVKAGEEAEVGQAVGHLAESAEELAGLQAAAPGEASHVVVEPESAATPEAPSHDSAAQRPKGKIRITPRAKRLAKQNSVDYTSLQGSGPGGRIVEKDIARAIEAIKSGALQAPVREMPEGPVVDGKRVKSTIPLQGMRKAISEHMVRSLQISAQLTAGIEVDMTEMIRFRNSQKKSPRFQDARLSFTDIFAYIIAKVLKEQPIMNASLIDDQIHLWEDVNVGVAVAIPMAENVSGLAVPVVRNADRMSLYDLSQKIQEIVLKAREGNLQLDDMTGGTFTLTNTGTFSNRWAWSTPILNQPEVGILQTAATVDRFVPVDGQPVIKPLMPLILTFDHRVIDGFDASRFISRVAELMEDPYQLVG